MANDKKGKQNKVEAKEEEKKPMEDQEITTELPADVAPAANNVVGKVQCLFL